MNTLELDGIKDERTGSNVYDLTKNLPYMLNVEEFERIYKLLLENVSETQKTYFKKLYERKELWARCLNKENSLGEHCTSLVENVNKLLKKHVGLKTSLVEYLYRTIQFTAKLNEKEEFTSEELLTYNSNYDYFRNNPFILNSANKLSQYAMKRLVINLIKSLSWITPEGKPFEVHRADNTNYKYIITKNRQGMLECGCSAFLGWGFPCEHLLRVLSEQKQEKFILKYFDQRWFLTEDAVAKDEIAEYLKILIEEEKKKPKSSQNKNAVISNHLREEEEKKEEASTFSDEQELFEEEDEL